MLVRRVTELTALVSTLQQAVAAKDQTLQRYHTALGPLDEFCTVQVQLREEIMSLRDTVRMWQERESQARSHIRGLERVIDGIRRQSAGGGDHESAEDRLADLQNRLSHAYLHRSTILEDIRKAGELFRAYEVQSAVMGVGLHQGLHSREEVGANHAGEHLQWKCRGKLADLELQLKQKESLIQALTAAAADLEKVIATSAFKDRIGEANRRCPGCQKPQWTSPYCPLTGHQHTGCDGVPSSTVSVSPSAINYGTLETMEEEAIKSGEWRKLVQVGSFAVSYQHVQTGKIVTDLRKELLEMRETQNRQQKTGAAETKNEERQQMQEAVANAVRSSAESSLHRLHQQGSDSMAKEIALLVRTLEERNEQIRRLKSLLRSVAESGMAGAAPPLAETTAVPASTPAAPVSPQDEGPSAREATAATATAMIGLGSEDLSMTETIRERLVHENALLNRRCTEVILELSSAKERVAALEAEVQALRFRDDQRANDHELRGQLQLMRDELLRERRRSLRLKEELDVLTDRSNEAARRPHSHHR